MAIPSSGPISLTDVQTEFGGANPIGINEYYAGGTYVPAGTSGTYGAVPSSGTISLQNFYGTSAVVYFFSQMASRIDPTNGYVNASYAMPVVLNNNLVLYSTPRNTSLAIDQATTFSAVNTATGALSSIRYIADSGGFSANMVCKAYSSSTDTLYFTWSLSTTYGYTPTTRAFQWGKITSASTTPALSYITSSAMSGPFNGTSIGFIALDSSDNIYMSARTYYEYIYGYDCCGPIYVTIYKPSIVKYSNTGSSSATWFAVANDMGSSYAGYGYPANIFTDSTSVYQCALNYGTGAWALFKSDLANTSSSYYMYTPSSPYGYWGQGAGAVDGAGNVYFASAGVGGTYKLNVAKVNSSGVIQWAKAFVVTGMGTSQQGNCIWGSDGYLYVSMTSYNTYGNCAAVYKLDSAGTVQWARLFTPTFQTSSSAYATFDYAAEALPAISQDTSSIYVAFAFQIRNPTRYSGTFLAKISKTSGTTAQTVSFSSAGGVFASGNYNITVSALSLTATDITITRTSPYAGRFAGTTATPVARSTTLTTTALDVNLTYAKANT
jgi:hypothetical protein